MGGGSAPKNPVLHKDNLLHLVIEWLNNKTLYLHLADVVQQLSHYHNVLNESNVKSDWPESG